MPPRGPISPRSPRLIPGWDRTLTAFWSPCSIAFPNTSRCSATTPIRTASPVLAENGDNAGDQFQDPAHPNLDYSNCGSDLRHNFVTSAIIRSSANGTYARQLLLGGWQLAPIVTATTGVPFTVTTGTDASLTARRNDRPNLIGESRAPRRSYDPLAEQGFLCRKHAWNLWHDPAVRVLWAALHRRGHGSQQIHSAA